MLAALLGTVILAQTPAESGCPLRAAILDALAVKGRSWETACGRAESGKTLIAAVERGTWSEGRRYAVAAILDHGAVRGRSDLIFETPESKEVLRAISQAEDWRVEIRPAKLGGGVDARIGILVNHGEDYFVGEEVVVLLRVASSSIESVWLGLGGHLDRRFDSCVLETVATFAVTADGQVSRSLNTKRTFRNAGVDNSLAADLKRKCVAPPKRTDTFPVLQAEGGVRPSNKPFQQMDGRTVAPQ